VDCARRLRGQLLGDHSAQQRPVSVGLRLPAPALRRAALAEALDQPSHHRVGGGQLGADVGQRPRHRGFRFSENAVIPSRKSSEAKDDARSSISSRSCSGLSTGLALSISIACLFPFSDRGALDAILPASSTEARSSSSSPTISWTSPVSHARRASKLLPVRNSSLVRARPTASRTR